MQRGRLRLSGSAGVAVVPGLRVGYLLAVALLVSAFVEGCSPPATPHRPSHLESFRVAGPVAVAPGTSATFKALLDRVATLSDVSEEAQWISSNPSVLSVNAGLATGHVVGEATITARFEEQQTSPTPVMVLPAGTYRLRGRVGYNTELGVGLPLSMARVEVPAVGLATTTDARGNFACTAFLRTPRFASPKRATLRSSIRFVSSITKS